MIFPFLYATVDLKPINQLWKKLKVYRNGNISLLKKDLV